MLQSAMLPKILKIMESMRSSFSKSLIASINYSGLAVPPISKKLAGEPPWYLRQSIVAMARAAPLESTPILPSLIRMY